MQAQPKRMPRALLLPSLCEVIWAVSLSPGFHGGGHSLQKQVVVSVNDGESLFFHLWTQAPLHSIRLPQTHFSKPYSVGPQEEPADTTQHWALRQEHGRPLVFGVAYTGIGYNGNKEMCCLVH